MKLLNHRHVAVSSVNWIGFNWINRFGVGTEKVKCIFWNYTYLYIYSKDTIIAVLVRVAGLSVSFYPSGRCVCKVWVVGVNGESKAQR